jgi:methionyl-tRNA synthetase
MRVANIDQAEFGSAFGIEMASIAGFGVDGRIGASWGAIAPGGQTTPYKHDEAECFVVLCGTGELLVDGRRYPVSAGSLVVLEPFESHILRNTGTDELRFADLYWRNAALRAQAAARNARSRLGGRPVFVFSTPPTPNGDLHLGHLSGPYLGADVLVRFLRATGQEAYHLTGSDDHQSYVVGRARQEDSDPHEIADRYAAEIRATLELMDVQVDQFTVTSRDADYRDGLQGFFSKLVAAGVTRMRTAALFDGDSGAYLYEVDTSGVCPTCGSPCGGNICEECGEPNTCVELADPRSALSTAPPRVGEADRYVIRLAEFGDVVRHHHRLAKVSPKLQQLAERLLARTDFTLPVTHPATWGVPPLELVESAQVIWVWPEMAYGFLHGIEQLGRRLDRSWQAARPQDDWKIIHFFGYDNSFYYSILFPVLYHLAYPEWDCDVDYNVNEFYLLGGKKFSTSRRHAIWGKDILTPDSVDAVRWYLAGTRGEGARTNFTLEDFHERVSNVLVGQWQHWLADLGRRVAEDFEGVAPDAGAWTIAHTGYLNGLQTRLAAIRSRYEADSFSLNRVVEEVNGLVADALRFAAEQARLRGSHTHRDEIRTAVALELATVRLLASVCMPLLPRFAGRVAAALGLPTIDSWPDTIQLVPPGVKIDLAGQTFFTPIEDPDA